MWFVYNASRGQFKAVPFLELNEGFEKLAVDELEKRMFKEAPSAIQKVGKWSTEQVTKLAIPTILGAVAGAVGARIGGVVAR